MKEPHAHCVQQRAFQAAKYRSDELCTRTGTETLGASQSK
jgi:hypothetical protein